MSDLTPWRLKPVVKEVVWGGHRLEQELGRIPAGNGPLGESWEAYAGSVISSGAFAGRTLGELFLERDATLFGARAVRYPNFPLLAKFIDAHQNLSIQVHPNDELAQQLEHYPYGKTEFWYIIDAAPGAQLVYGLTQDAPDREQLHKALQTGEFLHYCARVSVQKGDVVYIPAGTVHALTEGVFVYELQQDCDITYRLYDWGRTSREIHIEKGIQAIDLSYRDLLVDRSELADVGDYERVRLVECDYFASDLIRVTQSADLPARPDSFLLLTIIEGAGELRPADEARNETRKDASASISVQRGDTLFLPAGMAYQLSTSSQDEAILAIESGVL